MTNHPLFRLPYDLAAELQAHPMKPARARSLMLFPVLVVLGFAWLLALRATHRFATILLMENSLVEMATFLAFLGAAAWSVPAALRARARGMQGVFRLLLVFALVAFVAAMEEISWGQQFLNYDTPGLIRGLNQQGEFNVHNLPGLDEINSFVLPVFGLIGLAMYWPVHSRLMQALRPPLLLLPYFSTVAAAGIVIFITDWWVARFSFGMIMAWLTEVVELVMGVTCLLYALWKAHEMGKPRGAPDATT